MEVVVGIALTFFSIWVGWILGNRHTRELQAQNQMLEAQNQKLEAQNQKLSEILDTVVTLKGDEEARAGIEGYEQAQQRYGAFVKALKEKRKLEMNDPSARFNRGMGDHLMQMRMEEKLRQGPKAFMPKHET